MLVYIRGTPIWRPEYSVNIWNLLWLSRSRRLINSASTEQTLASKKAQNHKISIHFSTVKLDRSLVSRNLHKPEIQTALVSK